MFVLQVYLQIPQYSFMVRRTSEILDYNSEVISTSFKFYQKDFGVL